uniref:Reticulon n=1 Tax=Jaculus jaculus TaxID=51337 RepID=A0A8C5K1A9_JACJA
EVSVLPVSPEISGSFSFTEEAPSTASSTPDSTEGGNDDSDFRELHTAREFSEDDEEETTSQDWGTPRELTFSYIAFDGLVGSGGRRDSTARRPRPLGRSVSEPRDPPPQPGLGDSLESIPSLRQSPEPGRRADPDTVPAAERPLEDLRLRLDQLGWAARSVGSGEDSATSSSTPLEDEDPDGVEAQEAGEGEQGAVHVRWWATLKTLPQRNRSKLPLPKVKRPSLKCSMPPGTATDWLKTFLDVYEVPSLELSPPLWTAIGWVRKGPSPRTPPQVPLKWAESPKLGPSPRLTPPPSTVADLLYWKDSRTSGAVFTGLMVSLLCLLHFSIVSVAAHLALLGLCATISLRVYRKVLQAVHRGDGANPFQAYLDMDLTLTREQTDRLSQQIASHVVSLATQLRHFFLVEDLVDSLKLALLFYILTFVGAVFNGLTLLILGVIVLFTVPLLYRQHQAQIDQYVGLVTSQLSHIKAKIRAKIPGTGALASAASAVSGSKAKAE